MQRIALLLMLALLLVVHTGCRVSRNCCYHQSRSHTCPIRSDGSGASSEQYDAIPVPELDAPTGETAHQGYSEDSIEDFTGGSHFDQDSDLNGVWLDNRQLPAPPVGDLEV